MHFMEVFLRGNDPLTRDDLLRDTRTSRQWRVIEGRPADSLHTKQMVRVEGPALDFFALDKVGPDRVRGTGQAAFLGGRVAA